LDFIGAHDATNALFLTSLVGAILTTAQGDDAETQVLYNLLSDVAMIHPDIVSMAYVSVSSSVSLTDLDSDVVDSYDGLQDRVKDTFANSSNPSIIRAVSHIFRVTLQDPNRNLALRGSSSTIGASEEAASRPGRRHIMALEEWSLSGLASSFQFLALNRGHVTTMINWIPELVAKIIE
jgi:neurofibromin 1